MQRQKQKAVNKDKNDNCLVMVTLCASLSILFFHFFHLMQNFLNLVTSECTRATSPELWNQNTNRGLIIWRNGVQTVMSYVCLGANRLVIFSLII